ncbi:hypothetical protein M1247_05290 [Mycobacterium sp. 21AC1]|uniref:hypothetical protein n=1 Tax=[Mycobacterium] appelbergii TaxID=2939269 RepID=UPI0029394A57|nr:hypothetical protein [Mycobacterium sp. 21AC1]MDV3124317.1 hypothetical protein [Mycobacterium sp. 21AC1]
MTSPGGPSSGRKIVAFADDRLTLDYRPKGPGHAKGIDEMMAELFVYLGSFFAQLELNRFKTRAQDSHRALRQMDRWTSGVPPLGFKVVDYPSGKGKGLDTDETGKALLHEMAEALEWLELYSHCRGAMSEGT